MERKKKGNSSNFLPGILFGAAAGIVGTLLVKAFTGDDGQQTDKTPNKVPVKVQPNTQEPAKATQDAFNQNENIFCPITQEPMTNPYVIKNCGHSFQKDAIEGCIERKQECPVCRKPCTKNDLIPNYSLKNIVQDMIKHQPI